MIVGTHNTLDGAAVASPFADVLLFTEAIPRKVRIELADTHDVYVCRYQKDLCIAIRKTLGQEKVRSHYRLVHPGIAKVTPHRGTFWLTLLLEGKPTAVLVEHRINAAFPPFKRGERFYRPRMWRLHTKISLRIIDRQKRKGRRVLAGGDVNTPHGVVGYPGLHEVGDHFDRLASTRPLAEVERLSRGGSDHHRLRATVLEP